MDFLFINTHSPPPLKNQNFAKEEHYQLCDSLNLDLTKIFFLKTGNWDEHYPSFRDQIFLQTWFQNDDL